MVSLETRFDLDYCARAIASADDETFDALDPDERDHYRRLSEAAFDAIDPEGSDWHEGCVNSEDAHVDRVLAEDEGYERARDDALTELRGVYSESTTPAGRKALEVAAERVKEMEESS